MIVVLLRTVKVTVLDFVRGCETAETGSVKNVERSSVSQETAGKAICRPLVCALIDEGCLELIVRIENEDSLSVACHKNISFPAGGSRIQITASGSVLNCRDNIRFSRCCSFAAQINFQLLFSVLSREQNDIRLFVVVDIGNFRFQNL